MLKAKDLKALLEDVPDDTEIICQGAFTGLPNPVKHASLTGPVTAASEHAVVLCPMGSHLDPDADVRRQVHSLPEPKKA